ncbi:Insulin-like receptor [Pseudolycoriella hygida]|uniref:Insulin-like receptor n=1 Tax=Pseudolycoriella hygida TaxID=35572 RepID=A0A9Q0MP54_9DIPT|nr:Insulin-like receptor [Pseudolycoriella hygida]
MSVIKWEPPEKPNGRLTIYIVKAALIHDDPELLNQRNYCEEPITTLCEQYNNITKITESVPNPNPTDGERYSSVVSKNKIAQAALDNVNFENRLQNFIYVKRTFVNGSRIRRNTESTTYSDQLETNERMLKVVMANNNQTNGSTFTFKFDKLRHFSMYSISVMACRDLVDPLLRDDTYCSYPVVINQRTSKIDVADSVRMLNYRNVKDGDNKTTKFQLFWEEPTNPNGLILSYAVLLKRIDWANVRPTELCFTQKHYSSSNGQITLPQLSNGKYSISVKATSLAGDGYPSDPFLKLVAIE